MAASTIPYVCGITVCGEERVREKGEGRRVREKGEGRREKGEGRSRRGKEREGRRKGVSGNTHSEGRSGSRYINIDSSATNRQRNTSNKGNQTRQVV